MPNSVRIRIGSKPLRKALAATIFHVLGRGLVAAAAHDARVRREVATWPDGAVVTIMIAPEGPSATWRYLDGELKFLGGKRPDGRCDLLVTYKSVDVALPVLCGLKGILPAFAEHRSTLAGDIGFGMSLVRCLHIVEGYLFPDIIAMRILPERPLRAAPRLFVYASLVLISAPVGAAL